MKKICLICQNNFEARETRTKYCSRPCYYEMKRIRGDRVKWTEEMHIRLSKKYTGNGNPAFGKPAWSRGKKRPEMHGIHHPLWKGGRWVEKSGYAHISVKGVEKLEHRKVMEDYLGRALNSDEIIHHINHDKDDNRIQNLLVTTRSEHIKIHPPKGRIKMTIDKYRTV